MRILKPGSPNKQGFPLAMSIGLVGLILTLSVQAAPSVRPISDAQLPWAGVWDYRLDGEGKAWIAYYDQARLLHLRKPDGEERLMVPDIPVGQAPSGLAMTGLESGVALAWRDKFPSKALNLAQSDRLDASVLELGEDSEPLSRMELARTGKQLHALWLGEKEVKEDGPPYHLYYRSLDLEAQELSPVQRLMSGIYPVLETDEQGGVMAFSWLYDESPRRIVSRFRAAGTEDFGPAVTIAEVPEITPQFSAFRVGDRWFALWLAQYGAEGGGLQLEGAYSDDRGGGWKRFAFEDLRGFGITSLTVAADEKGHILIAVSCREPIPGIYRNDVRLIRSADRGETWSPARSLRPESVIQSYSSDNPTVAFGPEAGQVIVVWEDWRQIRPRLYASLSLDYGETWVRDNVPIPVEPNTNMGLSPNLPAVLVDGDRIKVLARQAIDDSQQASRLLEIGFTLDDLAEFAKAAADAGPVEPGKQAPATEERLRERVSAFWKAMMDGDHATTYELQDPYYRAAQDHMAYSAQRGRIKYSEYRIDSVRVDGWRAEVETNVKASIPAFTVPSTGEVISRPEREVPITEVWLWIDGDWYREYYSEANELRFTRY